MTRLYYVKCSNNIDWISAGALNYEFYVLAGDFTEATVKASSFLAALIARASKIPGADASALVLRGISETGVLAEDSEESIVTAPRFEVAEWLEHLVKKARTE